MKRRFYKTVIEVEVLSEDEPYEFADLERLLYDITEGHFSGDIKVKGSDELSPRGAAQALLRQRSDPEFFGLDDEGGERLD
tara:strand:- start:157 stop:399 length:243 start_codon:yes stop_codon:yes gene_type:complete